MKLTLNFYPFRLTIIENSPLNKKSNSLLVYKSSQLFVTLTTQEVKLTSCLQNLSTIVNSNHRRSQTHSLFTILTTSLLKSQTNFLLQFSQDSTLKKSNSILFTQSRNYCNTIIHLEQINKD